MRAARFLFDWRCREDTVLHCNGSLLVQVVDGNGLDEGFLTQSACKQLFGASGYAEIWGHRGVLKKRIWAEPQIPQDILLKAEREIHASVDIRTNNQSTHGYDTGHAYILDRLAETRLEVLLALDQRTAEGDDGEEWTTVPGSRGKHRRLGKKEKRQIRSWAGFVVVGAETYLPLECRRKRAAVYAASSLSKQQPTDHPSCLNQHLSAFDAPSSPDQQPDRTKILSIEEICAKLVEMGLAEHCEAFAENSIDGSMLEDLEELWDELKVEKKAHRMKILKWFRPYMPVSTNTQRE